MLTSSISDGTVTPPNPKEVTTHHEEGKEEGKDEEEENSRPQVVRGWWKKVMDLDEAKHQLLFSIPLTLTNCFYYLITLVSVMISGHLGDLQLAGATLAGSWFGVTGMAVMVGLSGGLETLCGQGFGAREYHMLGVYLQSSCIISLIFSIFISIIWFYTEPILILLHQSHDIARASALYVKFLIPGLFAYGLLQNILRFLQAQSVVKPLVFLSALPMLVHIVIAYALVYWIDLSFTGASVAVSVSLWISTVLLAFYVKYAKKFKQTWKGFSIKSFHYMFTDLKLALPSAAMENNSVEASYLMILTMCLCYASFEYWAVEILIFLAGLLPDSEITTPLVAICANTELIAYMITYGLSAAASTRVSNELGAGRPDQAKHAMKVTLKLSVLLGFIFVLALGFSHNIWIELFSRSSKIKEEFAAMTPLLATSILLDGVQCVMSGVARGCGLQHLATYVNLLAYYLIGLPISCILGFKFKLKVKGLWIGLICGLACQTGTLSLLICRAKWTKLNLSEA